MALVVAAVLAAAASAGPVAASAAAASATSVQDRYAAPGPAGEVVHQVDTDPLGATSYELWYPADLGPEGTRHPVVTWGNGSFEHPGRYEPTLRHLASWGFVVVAAWTDQAGTGDEILGGARRVIRYGEDPDSPLHGHVDGSRVAASGHSQGAGGSVRAATAPGSPVTTALLFDLPNRAFTFPPDTKSFDPSQLDVPVLFLSGGNDQLISGTATNQEFFRSVDGPAGMALLTVADHNAIQDEALGYRGYATAWLRYQLFDDPVAAEAFAGPRPELATAPGWQDQAFKGLSLPEQAAASTTVPSTSTVALSPTSAPPDGPTLPVTGGAVPLPLAALLLTAALLLRRASAAWPAVPSRGDRSG